MTKILWPLLLFVSIGWGGSFSLEEEKRYLQTLDTIMNKIDKQRSIEMGRELFVRKCAFCHGKDGRGRDGFAADLTRRISKERAKLNIQKGARNFVHSFPGGMPPMVPDDKRADVLADFVAKGFPRGHAGEKLYIKAHCARCHGKKGEGIRYRAPNIRYFDMQTIAAILKNGKFGILGRMPAYSSLAPYQVAMLGEFIKWLENGGEKSTEMDD